MYCRSSFETDCLSASNWAALSLEWRWGTAGAFDWELLFFFSLSRQLWPDCHKQPLVHITSTMTLVYTTFPINSSLKSIQAQTMHYGHMACANHTQAPPPHNHHICSIHKTFLSPLRYFYRKPTLPTLMPRVVPASNWPCSTPEAGSGPWWQEEVPRWCTGTWSRCQTGPNCIKQSLNK